MNATFDAQEFRKALGSFTTGVTVVTTRGIDNNDVGLTANSFNSVSLDPPMVLWSLGKTALSMQQFQLANYFAVHILSDEQQELSTRFAIRSIDKFKDLTLSRGPGDIPLLENCAACFVCKTVYQYEGGDHIIFVGEVINFEHSLKHPLLFHRGQYGKLAKNILSNSSADPSPFRDTTLGYLLRVCSHKLLSGLKQKLDQHEINVAQFYFLALASKSSGHETFNDLIKLSENGDNPPSDQDIDDLIAKDFLRPSENQIQITEKGTSLHMQLAAYYKAAESSALEVLDYDERQALQISLSKVAASFAT